MALQCRCHPRSGHFLRRILILWRGTGLFRSRRRDCRVGAARPGSGVKARERTGGAIKALLGLIPKTANRLTENGEEEIPVEAIQAGDRLRIRPGEKIPVGGTVAEAIVRGALARGISLSETASFQSITGKGVSGTVAGREVALGNARLMSDLGLSDKLELQEADHHRSEGSTAMFAAVEDMAAGTIVVADPIKQTTLQAITDLHQAGLKVVMLTGDNATTARTVAHKLGIDEVHADVLPQDKNRIVQDLRAQGATVVMAGDGINDAPALTAAHVGIAMGTGTDVAMESAGVTLLRGDLTGIVSAITLSRLTMRNIRQNLFLAFVYNGTAVPVAAGVLYPVRSSEFCCRQLSRRRQWR